MATAASLLYTPDQYLEMERSADVRSEYISGEIFGMSGASFEHNVIVSNIVSDIVVQLKGKPCRVCSSDMKVKIRNAFLYPDVVVVCGQPEILDDHGDVLMNPIVIVEVLSKSTEAFDRGEKFALYSEISTLREYILVFQDRGRVEQFVRQPQGAWLMSSIADMDAVLDIRCIGSRIRVGDIYDKVDVDTR